MIFKRDEGFRYTFSQPIPAIFTFHQINDREVKSSPGMADIIDISPEGMRISSKLLIPDIGADVVLTLKFKLNGEELTFDGKIVWYKEMGKLTEYGINLIVDDSEKDIIIKELKVFSKNNS
ncbi:PilZ domain-containing protein [Lysinibacillus fusiformis]|nr:PilZ domain-containing protein [Lysinibacillus fusiformis]